MLYEMRQYRCMPGRLPDVIKRFENITLGIFERFGIRHAGFYTVQIGGNNHDLIYFLQWESLAERERLWNAFATDPEWLEKRAQTESSGPLVEFIANEILARLPFEPTAK